MMFNEQVNKDGIDVRSQRIHRGQDSGSSSLVCVEGVEGVEGTSLRLHSSLHTLLLNVTK